MVSADKALQRFSRRVFRLRTRKGSPKGFFARFFLLSSYSGHLSTARGVGDEEFDLKKPLKIPPAPNFGPPDGHPEDEFHVYGAE